MNPTAIFKKNTTLAHYYAFIIVSIILFSLSVPQKLYGQHDSGHVVADTISTDSIPDHASWIKRVFGRGVYVDMHFYGYGNWFDVPDSCGWADTAGCIPPAEAWEDHLYEILFKNADTDSFVVPTYTFTHVFDIEPYNFERVVSFPCTNPDTANPETVWITEYNWDGYWHVRKQYIFPAGNYIGRIPYATLAGDDQTIYTDEMIWQGWNHLDNEFHFSCQPLYSRDIREPRVELVNKEDWKKWIPTANGFGATGNNNITLNFMLNVSGSEANDLDYNVKFRVFDITWYPGTRTNSVDLYNSTNSHEVNDPYTKYHAFASPTDHTILIDQEWNERLSWRACKDSVLNDMVILDSLNPDYDVTWNTGVADFGDTSIVQGYYDIEYPTAVPNNSTFSITYTSRDFAARCWTMPFITFKDSTGDTSAWYPVVIYNRLIDGLADYILPVPRDEETYMYSNDKFGDSTFYGRGDRLADEWEELFAYKDASKIENLSISQKIQDSLIFTDIYDSKPYYDNSNLDTTYYPHSAFPLGPNGLTVKDVGDGILNFEKYRGFYGILDSSYNEIFLRLHPARRNIFVTPIDEITDPSYANVLDRDNEIQYFSSIQKKFVQPGVDTNSVHLHTLSFLKNDTLVNDIAQHSFVKMPPFEEATFTNTRDFEYVFSLAVNNYLRNMPGTQNIASVYSVLSLPVPPNLDRYYRRLFIRNRDTARYDSLMSGFGVMGVYLPQSFNNSKVVPSEICNSFVNIRNIIQFPLARTNAQGVIGDTIWVKNQISKTFGHELGHQVNLKHQEDFNPFYISVMSSGAATNPPIDFDIRDCRSLLLSKYVNYDSLNTARIVR